MGGGRSRPRATPCSRCRADCPYAPVYNGKNVSVICYIDAFSGVSGDMLAGALADAGADQQAMAGAIASLDIGATVSFEKVTRRGVAGTKYHVHAQPQHAHRHLSHIEKIIGKSDLPDRAKERALKVFRRLGEAEAHVHGIPIEKVHFHEVGAADSIADIVGTCIAFDQLQVSRILCSPVNVGSGTVQTEHGTLPVPAPATARLLENAPVYARGPAKELTTPTGAAVVTTLAESFGVLPPMKLARTGYGAGSSDFAEHANVLRVILGERAPVEEALEVSVIEANIDDSSPQVLAYAAERILCAGALDVWLQPILMKKGRPGQLLRVLARPEDRERLSQIIFAETSTLGLRIQSAERRVQERGITNVETRYGRVRVKISSQGSAPEYEDCRQLALDSGVPLKEILAEAILESRKFLR